jgi:hypothetical protein
MSWSRHTPYTEGRLTAAEEVGGYKNRLASGANLTLGTAESAGQTAGIDRGCVKTSARFHTSLFRSLLRGLRAFRVEKIEKNLALLDRLQNFAEFLHGLDPERKTSVFLA